jgi:hypothetical protein
MLRVSPGAELTAIGWTFGVVDCGTSTGVLTPPAVTGALAAPGVLAALVGDEPAGESPPPPPQPARAAHTMSRAGNREEGFMMVSIVEGLGWRRGRLLQVVRRDAGRQRRG